MIWTSWLRTQRHSPRRPSLTVESLEDRCLLAGGVLDPTFGAAGLVSTDFGVEARVFAVAAYPSAGNANDGKIVAAGDVFLPKARTSTETMAIVRYNVDGTLDNTFAGTGKITTTLGKVMAIQVQPDGKVVAAGNNGVNFAVVRYNPNGTPDTLFGSGGMVVTAISKNSYDFIDAMVLQSDGKIVVAGQTIPWKTSNRDVALVRYNADGGLDASFGTGGKATTHLASPVDTHWDQRGVTLAIDPTPTPLAPQSARFVVGARVAQPVSQPVTQAATVVMRYSASGVLDTSFGDSHIGLVNLGPTLTNAEVAVQSDHSVIVAGSLASSVSGSAVIGSDFSLKRLKPDGILDASFGPGGGVSSWPDYNYANSVTIQRDGRILVAGGHLDRGTGKTSFMVSRYAVDGGLDTTFGANGRILGPGAPGALYPAVTLEPDGRIVIAYFQSSTTFELARILAAGPVIGSFAASPNPVNAGSNLTLTAADVIALNPGSSVTRLAFYLDSDRDGRLTISDRLLAYGVLIGTRTWALTFSTDGLSPEEWSFFAVAEDSFGVLCDPIVITASVI